MRIKSNLKPPVIDPVEIVLDASKLFAGKHSYLSVSSQGRTFALPFGFVRSYWSHHELL